MFWVLNQQPQLPLVLMGPEMLFMLELIALALVCRILLMWWCNCSEVQVFEWPVFFRLWNFFLLVHSTMQMQLISARADSRRSNESVISWHLMISWVECIAGWMFVSWNNNDWYNENSGLLGCSHGCLVWEMTGYCHDILNSISLTWLYKISCWTIWVWLFRCSGTVWMYLFIF